MKLFSFATIVAATGIAQVLAVPIVLVSSSNIPSVNHPVIKFVPSHDVAGGTDFTKMKKGPCRAHGLSQKAVDVSNLLRQAFGLPLIKSASHPGLDDGKVRILPFIGTPISLPAHGKDTIKVISVETLHDRRPHRGHHPHGRHRHHHLGKGSFINRIHYSIMNLGRWEGRAVAFVLGCGIGVLFRMLFVLAVVMYRAFKDQRGEEQHEYSQITIIEEIVDSPKSSPPSYADEKYPIVLETPKTPSPEESK